MELSRERRLERRRRASRFVGCCDLLGWLALLQYSQALTVSTSQLNLFLEGGFPHIPQIEVNHKKFSVYYADLYGCVDKYY